MLRRTSVSVALTQTQTLILIDRPYTRYIPISPSKLQVVLLVLFFRFLTCRHISQHDGVSRQLLHDVASGTVIMTVN